MRSSAAALLLLALTSAAATVLAGPVEFTQPTAGTVWTTGSQYEIVWQGKGGNAALLANAPLNIDLVYGNSSAVQTLGTIVTGCSEKDMRVRFQLQDDLPSGLLYAIRSGAAYSPQFEIRNKDGKSNDTTAFPALKPATPIGGSCAKSATPSPSGAVESAKAGAATVLLAAVVAGIIA